MSLPTIHPDRESAGLYLPDNIYVPYSGVYVWESLEILKEGPRRWMAFDLDRTLYQVSPERDILIQSSIVEVISIQLDIPIEEARILWDKSYAETESGSRSISDLLRVPRDEVKQAVLKPILEAHPVTPFIQKDPFLVRLVSSLKQRRNMQLAIVTSSSMLVARETLRAIGFSDDCFDILIDGQYTKYNGAAYERLSTLIPNFSYREGIMVGDNKESDIFAAQNFGIPTVWIAEKFNEDIDSLQVKEVHTVFKLGI